MQQRIFAIRKVVQEDSDDLKEICTKGFPKDEAFEIVKSLLEIEHFYVIKDNKENKIIGFIAFGIYSIRISHIMIIAIHPNFQRKGIGSKLLNYCEEVLKNYLVKKVRLEVRTSNDIAINFYKKHGFEVADSLSNYYNDSSDAYLMVKNIE